MVFNVVVTAVAVGIVLVYARYLRSLRRDSKSLDHLHGRTRGGKPQFRPIFGGRIQPEDYVPPDRLNSEDFD